MANGFVFSSYVFTFLVVSLWIYVSLHVGTTSVCCTLGLRYNFSSSREAFTDFNVEVSCDMWHCGCTLLWARPPRASPYSPKSTRCLRSVLLALLLISGIEANPGPPVNKTCNGLSFGLINCRSAVAKTALIHSAVDELKLDLLAITETWIKNDHPDTIKLDLCPPGYSVTHIHRPTEKTGGGVALIVRSDIKVRRIHFNRSYKSFEVLAVHLLTNSTRLNMVVLYRPPSSVNFLDEFEDMLDEAVALPGRLLLCVDFNSPSTFTTGQLDPQLSDIIVGMDMIQHVNCPTHNRGGLLDLIITPAQPVVVGAVTVSDLGISDHYMVSTRLAVAAPRPPCTTTERRRFANFDVDEFKRKLSAASVFTQPKDQTNDFAAQIRDDVVGILDIMAPLKRTTRRSGKRTNGWLNHDAILARRSRRRLERRYRRTRSDADRVAYRAACRSTNKIINNARRDFVGSKLAEAGTDCRARWRITNELLHRSRSTPIDPGTDTNRAESFCQFFSNKIHNIATVVSQQLSSCRAAPLRRVASRRPVTLLERFDVVTVHEVQRMINQCPSKNSATDLVLVWLLKSCKDEFSVIIADLANMSMTQGTFPDIFKIGHITPILKKAGLDGDNPANFRPITNLNTIGKLLERLVQNRLRRHIALTGNQAMFQSAYRALHSTETAMTKVVNDLLLAVDGGCPSVLLSLDISAAFDTLSHHRLMDRAEELFGVTGLAKAWLWSYLTGRSHCVSFSGQQSATVPCETGVPQGSVLGPLLFCIFTTPIGSVISDFNIAYHQYADDLQLYTSISTSTSSNGLSVLSECANAVTRWHLENGLLLNPTKTEALVTGSRHQLSKFDRSSGVSVDGNVVQFSKSMRVLGVTLDERLSFDDHVSAVVQSCNYHIRSLRHIRRLIDRDTANTLACAIVNTRLDYCNALLYGVSAKNVQRLQRIQNSLARVVCNVPYGRSATDSLHTLHWLPVAKRISYKIATITHRTLHTQQPTYLAELIQNSAPIRPLRSSARHLLQQPRTNTVTASRAFAVAAPRIWNSLPVSITVSANYCTFKSKLKTHLFTT